MHIIELVSCNRPDYPLVNFESKFIPEPGDWVTYYDITAKVLTRTYDVNRGVIILELNN